MEVKLTSVVRLLTCCRFKVEQIEPPEALSTLRRWPARTWKERHLNATGVSAREGREDSAKRWQFGGGNKPGEGRMVIVGRLESEVSYLLPLPLRLNPPCDPALWWSRRKKGGAIHLLTTGSLSPNVDVIRRLGRRLISWLATAGASDRSKFCFRRPLVDRSLVYCRLLELHQAALRVISHSDNKSG